MGFERVRESVSKGGKQGVLDSLVLHGLATSSHQRDIDRQLCSSTEEVSAFPTALFAVSSVSWLLGEKELCSVFTRVV